MRSLLLHNGAAKAGYIYIIDNMRIKPILKSGTLMRHGFAEDYTDHYAASLQICFLIVFNIETMGECDHF